METGPPRARPAIALALILPLASFGGLLGPGDQGGADGPAGYWEELGEDGRVWVPLGPRLEAAYLPPPDLGAYHNASEAAHALRTLALERPDLFTVRELATSVQGRDVLLVSVTAPGDASGRVRVLFDGAHHGDEVIGSEVLVRFLQGIRDSYDANATVRAMLDATVVDVVPMVNPDGVALVPTCSYYADCRKNARGVDLNRNYADHWGGTGSSGDPGSPTYRGTAPLSEPESAAVASLLDEHAYALYASLHSGAEVILWPYGWTTAAPPEEAIYQTLGDELSTLTGVPHGQVSRVLYGVSGDSMDHAYGSAAWRPIAVSPETYRGSGTAFDWWLLFNPPEDQLATTVERWMPFLWHLVAEAPAFAPVGLASPAAARLGPDAGVLTAHVTAPARRPLVGASVHLDPLAAPLRVHAPNPVVLADAAGTQDATFTLEPLAGGSHTARFVLDAGVQGTRERTIELTLDQVGASVAVLPELVGSPDTATLHVSVDTGPFEAVQGRLVATVRPEGIVVGDAPFDATPGAPFVQALPFEAMGLGAGAHVVDVVLAFNATDSATVRPGAITVSAPFSVVRPEVTIEKRFETVSPAGEPLLVSSVYRNRGSMPATSLVVRETVPPGYAYWFRDGPLPIPVDPLGRPVPDSVELRADGGVDLVYRLADLAPGAVRLVQYRLVPAVPGEAALGSAWSYEGVFTTTTVGYHASGAPRHTTVLP